MSEFLCYVAAVVGEADRPTLRPQEDLGPEFIQVEDPPGWNPTFARLISALGLES